MQNTSRVAKIAALVAASVVYAFDLFINYLSVGNLPLGRAIGFFETYNTSLIWSARNTFKTSINPVGWTFGIWGIIYLYQLVILAFCWTLTHRRVTPLGPYLCCQPDLLPYGLMIAHICTSVFNGTWMLLVDRADYAPITQVPMACVLIAMTLSLYAALFFTYRGLWKEKAELQKIGRATDYWLVVGIIENGLSVYATWVTIASFLNLNNAITYVGGASEASSSTGCLSALIIVALAYAISDLTLLDMHTRFVFAPHLVLLWAACGILVENYTPGAANSILTIILTCLVLLALIAKLVLIAMRRNTNPIFCTKVEEGSTASFSKAQAEDSTHYLS